LAKVNSSAMSARQPEVPNLIFAGASAGLLAMAALLYRGSDLGCRGGSATRPKVEQGKQSSGRVTNLPLRSQAMTDKLMVLVTCGSAGEARKIARALVEQRLAACGNIVPRVQSIYRWKGKVESAGETLIILKTSRRRFPALRRAVERLHSYDTPEIVALPIAAGARKYLAWLAESLRLQPSDSRKRKPA
jgi:periplasmic divalent cation tolerance protein